MLQKFVALFKRKGFIKTIESYTDDQLLKNIGSDMFGEQNIVVYDTVFLRYIIRFKREYLYVKVDGFFVDLYIDIPGEIQSRLINVFRKKNDMDFKKKQETKRKYL